ncbi:MULTISPECIES: HAD family hydrolase [Burkholderia]|uniref:phosphoglycolate phosphatase n=1 Tax=Burkholderia orbicola (strain AU 1054) TaxID=331271 RepID=A0A0H2XU64_BURO1|nr:MULTISPECIES: HAD-IA family hydrolase [Burkholderia]EKS9843941.1 HAD-IA family hydrolase [Burkholderia cepacia]BEV49815.1 HAD family hydrolase [Burkholderia contaminans]ABK11496.1 HAD-superfamily hydrolase, subfamily IA, variant 3 [Burkholderia cenocepacia HI2424]MBJ9667116.1 HAD-IA family hydrolase [Burkholderia cenocepacia]MBJ9730830.1 HAD-IA family hydrolase [Burkholderia cenocepacia]
MSVRAVIFDFDLTLADSSAAIIECTEYALHQLGATGPTPAQIRAVIGLPLPDMFRSLAGETEAARAEAFARHFVVRADEIMVPGTRVYPEVPPLLATLREQGLAVAVVSSKFRYRIDAILERNGLQSLVDVLIGGEDVQRHKPDPEGLVQALARLGLPAAAAIYVGDHAVDAQAAERAGVPFVGAVSGMTSFDAWAQAGKQAVPTHIGELVGIVQRMQCRAGETCADAERGAQPAG